MSSSELGNELATIERELSDVTAQIELGHAADASALGGMLAALTVRAENVRRRKLEAERVEAAARADAEAKRLASEHAARLAAIESQRAALATDFAKWCADLGSLEAAALDLWQRYDALQNAVIALTNEAKAMGVAGVVLPRNETIERVRRGGSPLTWYWRRRQPVAPGYPAQPTTR